MQRIIATKIVKTLQENGYQAFFAGGCVRDVIMGFDPKDYDIATSAFPLDVEDIFKNNTAIGKAFGVIEIREAGYIFEVASFRFDGPYSDGRRPDFIEFSDMEEDAKRRDLTINGMFYNPISEEIHDFVNGKEDIDKKLIKFIGNPFDRIKEDKLRMLRAIRFFIRFEDFRLDSATMNAIKTQAENISIVSDERIRDELVKMLKCHQPRKMLNALDKLELLDKILPEVSLLKGCKQHPLYHAEGDAWEHTIRVLESLPKDASDELIWAAFLHDIGKPKCSKKEDGVIRSHGHAKDGAVIAEEILIRLKFSNKFIDRVVALVRNHMKPFDGPDMKKSTIRRLLAKDYFDELIELAKADCAGTEKPSGGDDFKSVDRWIVAFDKVKKELKDVVELPPPLISGNDLIRLGFIPGPIFKEILDRVSTLQLDGEIVDKDGALNVAKSYC